jgi:hypothetical protein
MPQGDLDMKEPKFNLTPAQMLTYVGPLLLVIAAITIFMLMGLSR